MNRTVYAIIFAAVALLGYVIGEYVPRFGFMGPPPFAMDQFPAMDQFRADAFPEGPPPSMRANDISIFSAMQTLHGDSRKAAEEAMKAHFPEVKQALDQVEQKRRAVFEAAAGTPADLERLGQSLKELREASFAAQQKSQDIFLDIARGLPADERADFVRAATAPRGMPFGRPR